MVLLTTEYNGLDSVIQFITVFVIFVFVLAITYFTTRVAGGYKKKQMTGRNIEIVETVAISGSKYIQIVRIGTRYCAIGVSKDSITYLMDIDKEALDFTEPDRPDSFKNILEGIKKTGWVKNDEENNN